jgi:hypothetical protein
MILLSNWFVGYLGLNAYMTPEPDPINSFFLHNNRDICDYLGKSWELMKPVAIVRKLVAHLL